ncbi:hypothetical protein [Actinopolyspora halophila]|uniref:hypothetical protein n=1 Tax=Actinopolyspora halophila TaxID=1850 RepID=UPI0003803938|nr:hypothetical protein [Actinopolyspora halophila]
MTQTCSQCARKIAPFAEFPMPQHQAPDALCWQCFEEQHPQHAETYMELYEWSKKLIKAKNPLIGADKRSDIEAVQVDTRKEMLGGFYHLVSDKLWRIYQRLTGYEEPVEYDELTRLETAIEEIGEVARTVQEVLEMSDETFTRMPVKQG